ncbi:AAA family ATPase [Rossellomorea vietnamensis]|uniref:AAA family ATPase n=1 Tax=Rossellomorea vietnamensis TaxID=218284 RepID=A0A5D4NQZ7_9BACI|nr:AAA family ATPase [Rossellomorea vietnamensis]TYS16743.1 AAA family ATPase [Rossellomorea vietnamensis]
MKLVLIFGPQAVGKMTVGQALSKKTGMKLLHNHMTIDLLQPLFGFTPEMWRLTHHFREEIYKSFSRTDEIGLITTFIWAFNMKEDWGFVEKITSIFKEQAAEIYLVELEADIEERIKRNVSPNRLEHKPTKRNTEQSEEHLLSTMKTLRLNSQKNEIQAENYLRINNTSLSPEEVADKIKTEFSL